MGERLLCKQEVDGSIPFTSTNLRCATARLNLDREKQAIRRSAKAGVCDL